ncbi:hypothetical protein [Methanobacterium spitsbergense]|uniref:Uncharacterized protein n=1 Tax=Methanobacterium spitsbergense TaxID=2874285 RepID=A0A8T5UZQ4_9EURY|nr:hypothetical protein [Methanobacterium spitsbergense]MBZ2166293.1 hypothetical protein [Methanobacterium spitsbergense]
MVSNEEIKSKLGNKREGIGVNGYLVCNSCQGVYELQSGENPEDFSSQCECGGNLKYNTTAKIFQSSDDPEYKKHNRAIIASYILIVLFLPLALVGSIYLITRDNKRAKYNGKIVMVLCFALVLVAVVRGIFM